MERTGLNWIMRRTFLATCVLGLMTANCALAQDPQDPSFQYSREEETVYCLRVFWATAGAPTQFLMGVRDKDKDYGPYNRLEVIRFNRGQMIQRPITVPASQPSAGPEVVANFSPSGVLWFATLAGGNQLRINRIKGTDVVDREIDLGKAEAAGDLVLSTLRAVSETEVWITGRKAGNGMLIKLSGINNTPEISHIAIPFGLKDSLLISNNEFVLAGTDYGDARSKVFAPTTRLALGGGDSKLRIQAPINGLLQDISPVSSNLIAVLTSTPAPGELSLHTVTTALEFRRSVTLLKEQSFTGRAFLASYRNFVIVYASNLGKCSVTVIEPDSGRLIRQESIATGPERCIDIRAAANGNEVLLATTLWRLEGNSFRVGVQAIIRSMDDLVTSSR